MLIMQPLPPNWQEYDHATRSLILPDCHTHDQHGWSPRPSLLCAAAWKNAKRKFVPRVTFLLSACVQTKDTVVTLAHVLETSEQAWNQERTRCGTFAHWNKKSCYSPYICMRHGELKAKSEMWRHCKVHRIDFPLNHCGNSCYIEVRMSRLQLYQISFMSKR